MKTEENNEMKENVQFNLDRALLFTDEIPNIPAAVGIFTTSIAHYYK